MTKQRIVECIFEKWEKFSWYAFFTAALLSSVCNISDVLLGYLFFFSYCLKSETLIENVKSEEKY